MVAKSHEHACATATCFADGGKTTIPSQSTQQDTPHVPKALPIDMPLQGPPRKAGIFRNSYTNHPKLLENRDQKTVYMPH